MVVSINKLRNKKGFTLIELIVVLAVLAIIMAIAVPRFTGVQETAKIDADYSTGAMIAKAAEFYVAQNEVTDPDNIAASEFELSDFEFQSAKIAGFGRDDVNCVWNKEAGTITVSVVNGDVDYQLYPIPEDNKLGD